MNTRPRLIRSIPFWLLIVGSLASVGVGAYLLIDKLGAMETALTQGTATGIEVYVGQIWAVLGAILIGAGVVGLGLTATLGALRSLAAPAVVENVQVDWQDDLDAQDETPVSDTEARPATLEDADVETSASDPAPTATR
ncbi:dinucleotide-utilizing enzyme [Microbacterium dauci]|uniref:Dinucleotide-utilizing enzyme n=1 Tax=Microbacterium dauci TaxID=3048008 RepID=A0ABT6ZGC8_9MICO|nr:dinucleotide-utilizing enzyme [Microbacterium sp. LX3-4]MDJ1115205.1 dinucleotide-utilizing enzyme [Microbacterium sp. LX3-4]